MTWRVSFVLVALVVACGGSSDGSGGAAGSGGGGVGGTGNAGGATGVAPTAEAGTYAGKDLILCVYPGEAPILRLQLDAVLRDDEEGVEFLGDYRGESGAWSDWGRCYIVYDYAPASTTVVVTAEDLEQYTLTLATAGGECWTDIDCETKGWNAVCIPAENAGLIPGEVQGRLGVCGALPYNSQSLSFYSYSPGRAAEDGFVVEPGTYDLTMVQRTFRRTSDPLVWEDLDLPRTERRPPDGLSYQYGAELRIRVVDPEDPTFDVECDLLFDDEGQVVSGGIVLRPARWLGTPPEVDASLDPDNIDDPKGQVLCPSDESGAAGILIEYDVWASCPTKGCLS